MHAANRCIIQCCIIWFVSGAVVGSYNSKRVSQIIEFSVGLSPTLSSNNREELKGFDWQRQLCKVVLIWYMSNEMFLLFVFSCAFTKWETHSANWCVTLFVLMLLLLCSFCFTGTLSGQTLTSYPLYVPFV